MWRLARPALFALDPEAAHHVAMWGLSLVDVAPAIARALRKAAGAERPTLATSGWWRC